MWTQLEKQQDDHPDIDIVVSLSVPTLTVSVACLAFLFLFFLLFSRSKVMILKTSVVQTPLVPTFSDKRLPTAHRAVSLPSQTISWPQITRSRQRDRQTEGCVDRDASRSTRYLFILTPLQVHLAFKSLTHMLTP